MELINDFTVQVPVDEAWKVLTDVEGIAPCLPGAQLQEIEGDIFRGVVKIKVGPITAQFKGQATFVERDDVNHRAVLKAEGRDTGGKGNAAAQITAVVEPAGERASKCTVTTDLHITGKVAQFGRGALADVSTKLLEQFVACLEAKLAAEKTVATMTAAAEAPAAGPAAAPAPEAAAPAEAPAAAAAAAAAAPAETATAQAAGPAAPAQPTVRKIDAPAAAPVDLLDAAGAPLAKRLIPAGIVTLLLLILLRRFLRKD
jgi:carbon monoxide dehydrogenase subunit G